MLLLKIGIWESLSAIVASNSFQGVGHEMFRQRVVEKRMPQLRQATGSILRGRYPSLSLKCI